MIFVTVGTQLPFDRLIKTVDSWCEKQKNTAVFAQVGPKSYLPIHIEHADFISPTKANELFSQAKIIVAHAGMGSVLTALKYQKTLIIMPRKASLGEHRNEHQLATAKWVENIPGIFVAWDETELLNLLERCDELAAGNEISTDADERLIDYVKNFIQID